MQCAPLARTRTHTVYLVSAAERALSCPITELSHLSSAVGETLIQRLCHVEKVSWASRSRFPLPCRAYLFIPAFFFLLPSPNYGYMRVSSPDRITANDSLSNRPARDRPTAVAQTDTAGRLRVPVCIRVHVYLYASIRALEAKGTRSLLNFRRGVSALRSTGRRVFARDLYTYRFIRNARAREKTKKKTRRSNWKNNWSGTVGHHKTSAAFYIV